MTPRPFKCTRFRKGILDFRLECITLLKNDFFKQRYKTFNVTILGQDRIDPKTHLCRTFFTGYKSMGIFRFAQGQLTRQPLVRSAPILNSVQTLWLSLLLERMKKIQSKMRALEQPQDFLHYNPMGAICCHGNQSSNPTWSKT